jgi:hypothetical protein
VRGAAHSGIDDVVDPRDTRRLLVRTFDRCAARKLRGHPPKYRSISPI